MSTRSPPSDKEFDDAAFPIVLGVTSLVDEEILAEGHVGCVEGSVVS